MIYSLIWEIKKYFLDLLEDILTIYFFFTRKNSKKTFKEVINKKKDRIFIFGSGGSINNLNKRDIKLIKEHNTLSFNWFIYQNILDIDFMLLEKA